MSAEIARHISNITGIEVSFLADRGDMKEFSVKRYRRLKIISADGSVQEAFIHDNRFMPSSLPVYYTVKLADVDWQDDKAAEFMIRNRLSR